MVGIMGCQDYERTSLGTVKVNGLPFSRVHSHTHARALRYTAATRAFDSAGGNAHCVCANSNIVLS